MLTVPLTLSLIWIPAFFIFPWQTCSDSALSCVRIFSSTGVPDFLPECFQYAWYPVPDDQGFFISFAVGSSHVSACYDIQNCCTSSVCSLYTVSTSSCVYAAQNVCICFGSLPAAVFNVSTSDSAAKDAFSVSDSETVSPLRYCFNSRISSSVILSFLSAALWLSLSRPDISAAVEITISPILNRPIASGGRLL